MALTQRVARVQVALETAILQMVRNIEEGTVVDYTTVADSVLSMAESLTVEAERRESERNAGLL